MSTRPYGSWPSPVSAEAIVQGGIGLGDIVLDGADTYWAEARPREAGRVVVVRCMADGRCVDCTPEGHSVGSRVHEYGGGAFTVVDGRIYYVNLSDQQIYHHRPDREPIALTAVADARFADLRWDAYRQRVLAVCELHHPQGEPENQLVAVAAGPDGSAPVVLAKGADFYSSPTLSPDGRRLAWLSWNHPAMPWDSSELWLAELDAHGMPHEPRRIAGGPGESLFQPQWGADNTLYCVSDRTGWWNLYRCENGHLEPLCTMAAEFGLPHWVFGLSTYALADGDGLYCAYCEEGRWTLGRLQPGSEALLEPLVTPYTQIDGLRGAEGRWVFRAGAPDRATAIVEYAPHDGTFRELRRASEPLLSADAIAQPIPMRFPTHDGGQAHAFFYPPTHPEYHGPIGEQPPLIVIGHGGPTSATSTALNPQIQFWTSRGFAVVDVNYRGSTGYGRAYHQALNGGWGVVDVADCVAAARYLIEQGRVDPERCAIRGRSAGGYSTLAALTFHDLFRAGASYYGISDLEILARDTHKFESRYLEQLVGPYPEARETYRARSPIHHVERLAAPVIFFQGLEDKVVPPNQAEHMVEALRAKQLPVAYVTFPDERHGFRQAANIKRALEAELYFYSRVFGFPLADALEPVAIDNLPPVAQPADGSDPMPPV